MLSRFSALTRCTVLTCVRHFCNCHVRRCSCFFFFGDTSANAGVSFGNNFSLFARANFFSSLACDADSTGWIWSVLRCFHWLHSGPCGSRHTTADLLQLHMCSAPGVESIEELLTEDKWIFLEDFASSQLRHIAHLQSIIGEVAALRTKLSQRATSSPDTEKGNAEPHTPAVGGAREACFAAALCTSSIGNSDLSTISDPIDLIRVQSSTSQRARLKTRISGGLKHLTQTNEFKLTTRSQSQITTVISQSRFGRSLLEKKLFGGWIAQLVESPAFDNVVAILIVLNTILIGMSTHFEFRCGGAHHRREPQRANARKRRSPASCWRFVI